MLEREPDGTGAVSRHGERRDLDDLPVASRRCTAMPRRFDVDARPGGVAVVDRCDGQQRKGRRLGAHVATLGPTADPGLMAH
ncbi:MAG: hypothetical protein ABL966_09270 [Acidimicrobiales bacterium]